MAELEATVRVLKKSKNTSEEGRTVMLMIFARVWIFVVVWTPQETVEVLLRHQADVNARDKNWQTPLHVAAANNAVKCAEYIIPCLTNVNVSDRSGRTSLHHAAFNGHLEVLYCLSRDQVHHFCSICVSGRLNQWARAQCPRIFFSFWGAPNWMWWNKFLKLIILLPSQRSTVRENW